jgi:hypothetical protein
MGSAKSSPSSAVGDTAIASSHCTQNDGD